MARKTTKEKAQPETIESPEPTTTPKKVAKKPLTGSKSPAKSKPVPKVVADIAKGAPTKKLTLLEEMEAERQAMLVAAKSRPRKSSRLAEPEAASELAGTVEDKKQKSRPKAVAKRTVAKDKAPSHTAPSSVESLPVPTWRKAEKQAKPEPEASDDLPVEEAVPNGLAPRRSKSRRNQGRREVEVTAVVAPAPHVEPRGRGRQKPVIEDSPAVVTAPVEVKSDEQVKVIRESIKIPEGAAQVAMLNDVPTIVKGKEVLPPLFFFASAPDESRMTTVLEEVKLAAENGVHVFSFLVELEVDFDRVDDAVTFAAFLTKKVSSIDPDCHLIFRTVFVATPGWERKYTAARYVNEEGDSADPSLSDDRFWNDATECLSRYVQKIRKLDKDNRILGIHLERGEWFLSESNGYDRSDAARTKFQEWLRHRYRNDVVSLRAAWFDGKVSFESINVPDLRDMRKLGNEFVRTDRKSRPWVDYHLFLSDAACERIADLAYAAKKASEGHFLVGASYGYTFEWSHPASGHLSLGKLLRCPDLDYIGGPPSYRNREPGGTSPFPAPIDSFSLNGKLYISEEDFKTPISGQREPDDFNPVMKTPQALGNVHWRGAGAALAHSSGACWMDSWGNGWLSSRGIWERAKTILDAMVWRIGAQPTAPDVAVFVDERSLAYLVDGRAFEELVQNVRESIMRAGMSAGFYLLSDLAHRENFPDCKLHVFMNAWDLRPEVRSAIKTRLQKDGKVLFWLYCAGLFEGGRESLERVREVTGIALRPQPFFSKAGTTILNSRDLLCQNLPEQAIAKGGQLEPSYFAIPEEGHVLGEYSHTGLPSFVVRKFESDVSGSWHSVFMGEPVVTPGLFRSLGQLAGVHVWSFQNDVVHVKAPFLTVHCTGTAPRTIALPDKYTAFNLVEGDWAMTESNSLKFQGLDGSTHSFMVGPKADIEALLSIDPAELLNVNELKPKEDNTLHWDMMRFDVPIMKLDEWVEETWSEEHADDLLLKPSMFETGIDDTPVEIEEPQRSRGRRQKPRRNFNSKKAEEPDGAINVMFRKRE